MTFQRLVEAEAELKTASRPPLPPFFGGPVGGVVLFVVGYALVDLLPVLLPDNPSLFGLRSADLVDPLLIFVLVALYVRLGLDADLWRTPVLRVANAAALVLLVQGHAVHLAANAIAEASDPTAPAWDLTYFLDEHWGHTELHLAFILMAVLFIVYGRSTRAERPGHNLSKAERAGLYLATVAYGLLLAADAIEGQTVPLMLPVGIGLFLWAFLPRLKFAWRPLGAPTISVYRYFFAASFGLAAVALVAYGVVMRGFPQFSAL